MNIVTVLYWNDRQKSLGLEKVTRDIMAIIRESMGAFEATAESIKKSTDRDA